MSRKKENDIMKKMFFAVFAAFVCLVTIPFAPVDVIPASHAASCPETLACPTYNGGSMMRSVYKTCDAQGDTVSFKCTYYNGSTVTKTPASTSCNECVVNTSQGAAQCNQTTLTTFANASCSAGLASSAGRCNTVVGVVELF